MDTPTKSANDLAMERTDLSIERTVMAAGRTLMGWVRTSLSMISFGFTIYKFMQSAIAGTPMAHLHPHGPRRLGLFLIAVGTLAVILGTIEYQGILKRLNRISPVPIKPLNASMVIAFLIGLLGLFLFITIYFRTEIL